MSKASVVEGSAARAGRDGPRSVARKARARAALKRRLRPGHRLKLARIRGSPPTTGEQQEYAVSTSVVKPSGATYVRRVRLALATTFVVPDEPARAAPGRVVDRLRRSGAP